MANTVKLKRSATPAKVPSTSDLDLGELAINTYDGKLYLKKDVGGVQSIVDVTSGGGAVSSVNGETGAVQLTATDIPGVQVLHGFVFPYEVSLSYNKTNRTITITPSGATFDVWVQGVKYTKTGAQTSTAHTNASGSYFLYYDATGTLVWDTNPWDFKNVSPVAYVFYSTTAADGIALFELHTYKRNPEWHESQHFAIGTFVRSGLDVSGYVLSDSSSNASITYQVSSGIIVDEDIEYSAATLADGGPYTIIYRTGATEFNWTTAATVPLLSGATFVQYNQLSGGSYSLTEISNTQYVNYYLFATTAIDADKRFFIIPGQAVHSTLSSAQGENVSSLALGSFGLPESVAVWKFTYQANTGWNGTTGRVRLIEVNRVSNLKGSLNVSITTTTHNLLTGRDAADSHPATAISFTPTGNLSSTTVAAALAELDTEKFSASGTLGVANGGTGTTTQFTLGSVLFAGASGVYSQDNANFFWDDTNNLLGLGTTAPGAKLHVRGGNLWYSTTDFVLNTTGTIVAVSTGAATGDTYGLINATKTGGSAWSDLVLQSGGGSVGIGGAPSAGRTLEILKSMTGSTLGIGVRSAGQVQSDVTSNARYFTTSANTAAAAFTCSTISHFSAYQGTFGASSAVTTQQGFYVDNTLLGATNNYGFFVADAAAITAGKTSYAFYADNDVATGGGTTWNFYAAGTASNYLGGKLGIGTTAITNVNLRVSKPLTGSTTAYNIYSEGAVQSDATNGGYYFTSAASTQDAVFTVGTVGGFYATQGTFGASSTVTNQYGFAASSALTGATNNYGFFSNIASGTGRWNFYAAGTASNYFAGNVGIGISPLQALDVNGAAWIRGGRLVPASGNGLVIDFGGMGGANVGSLQGYDYGTATARNICLQIAGGNVGVGTGTPRAQLELSSAAFLAADGGYFGGGAYYSSGWKNAVTSQGGWVIRNNSGTFSVWTGPSPGAVVNSAVTMTQQMYIDGAGIIGINGTLRNAVNSGNFLYDAYASDFTLRNHGFFDGRIEVNNSGTGNRFAYIDFHGDDTYTDYSLRLLRGNGGVNAGSELSHRGTGALTIQTVDAGAMYLKTASVSRITLAADGSNVAFGPIIVGKSNTATFVDANDTGSISVRGDATYAATMSFHRTGVYAVNFGLDTDNFLKVGGWSMGAVKYKIVYETGSWGISVTGSSASCTGNAATATLATKASTLSMGGGNGTAATFNWSGQSGQPTWLWGSNDGSNHYVWNPSNFSVNYATTAGAGTVRVWVRFSGTTISNHANMTSITVYSGTIYNINFAITLANTTYCTQFTINEGATYTTRYAGIIGDQNTTYCRAYTYGFNPTGAIAIIY